jgi:hypothetical protein
MIESGGAAPSFRYVTANPKEKMKSFTINVMRITILSE